MAPRWGDRHRGHQTRCLSVFLNRKRAYTNMKYLIFAGLHYYPSGGWEDFKGERDTEEDAVTDAAIIAENEYCGGWWQVVRVRDGKHEMVWDSVVGRYNHTENNG